MNQTLVTADGLREQARRFEQAAQKLAEAAAALDGSPSRRNGRAMAVEREVEESDRPAGHGTRLPSLKNFLLTNGPMRRSEIMRQAGMPKGTVAYLLKESNGFKKDKQKRWYVEPETPAHK